MNQASRYVDLPDWIVGAVDSVMAHTATLARNIGVEDTGVAGLKWRNGAMGSVNVMMLAYPKNLEGSITILGAALRWAALRCAARPRPTTARDLKSLELLTAMYLSARDGKRIDPPLAH